MKQQQKLRTKDQQNPRQSTLPENTVKIHKKPSLWWKSIYKILKYVIMSTVIMLIVLAGITVLGDNSSPISKNKKIYNVYQNDTIFIKTVQQIDKLFGKRSSKVISNRAINLFLEKEIPQNPDTQQINSQFSDLLHFVDFYLAQRHQGENVVHLPLNLNGKKTQNILPVAYSTQLLTKLKRKTEIFLENLKLTPSSSTKDLKWDRIKKYIDQAKFADLFQLLKENLVNNLWKWIKNEAKVILLIADDSDSFKNIKKNNKFLKRWIKDNQDSSEIIILSRFPVDRFFGAKKDQLKSYKVEVSAKKLQQNALCNYLAKYEYLSSAQCLIIKNSFNTLGEFSSFVQNFQQVRNVNLALQKKKQSQQILSTVCEKGHTKYYFYPNQQAANKLLTRSKKSKKSRLDRQIEVLIVKWSHLKRAIGLSRLKDVFSSLTSESEGDKLSLREANEIGLIYDFDVHELKWRGEEEKLSYEVRMGRSCRSIRQAEEQMRNAKSIQKEQLQSSEQTVKDISQSEKVQSQEQVIEILDEQNKFTLQIEQHQQGEETKQPQESVNSLEHQQTDQSQQVEKEQQSIETNTQQKDQQQSDTSVLEQSAENFVQNQNEVQETHLVADSQQQPQQETEEVEKQGQKNTQSLDILQEEQKQQNEEKDQQNQHQDQRTEHQEEQTRTQYQEQPTQQEQQTQQNSPTQQDQPTLQEEQNQQQEQQTQQYEQQTEQQEQQTQQYEQQTQQQEQQTQQEDEQNQEENGQQPQSLSTVFEQSGNTEQQQISVGQSSNVEQNIVVKSDEQEIEQQDLEEQNRIHQETGHSKQDQQSVNQAQESMQYSQEEEAANQVNPRQTEFEQATAQTAPQSEITHSLQQGSSQMDEASTIRNQ